MYVGVILLLYNKKKQKTKQHQQHQLWKVYLKKLHNKVLHNDSIIIYRVFN